MSDIKDFRPLEGQECTTRIVLGTPCKDDDEDGDELEWLARNKRAPPHTTRVREYPSIRYTYTVRYRVYPPLVSRDSRDSEPVPLVTQRIYRTPYATGAAWCERGRETYQPVRMRRRQFQPARSTNGKARQRRSAGRSTCSQSERLNNVVWFGHDNTSTSVVMFSFFRILESAKDVAPSSPAKTQPRSNSAVPHPPPSARASHPSAASPCRYVRHSRVLQTRYRQDRHLSEWGSTTRIPAFFNGGTLRPMATRFEPPSNPSNS